MLLKQYHHINDKLLRWYQPPIIYHSLTDFSLGIFGMVLAVHGVIAT
jgi:hypothetical protein